MSHAIQMDKYGPPAVLSWRSVDICPLGEKDVRVRTLFAAVNQTDLHIRAGDWPVRSAQPFPYVPGVEVVGVVEETGSAVTEWRVGDTVVTMMQGLGGVRAERAGGYAELVTVDADALASVPESVPPVEIAALGLAAVTAFEGLRRLGRLSGLSVLVTGAAGGVGSAATALARAQGASVTGTVTRTKDRDYVRDLGAQEVIVVEEGTAVQIPSDRFDGVLDVVGGELFETCVKSLRPGGTLSLVGAVAGAKVSFDAWDLIRPVSLTGYSTESLTGPALRQAVAALCDWVERREIRPPDYIVLPLDQAGEAHELLENRIVTGRVLLASGSASARS